VRSTWRNCLDYRFRYLKVEEKLLEISFARADCVGGVSIAQQLVGLSVASKENGIPVRTIDRLEIGSRI
jgi:hypothetical protein